MKMAENLGSNCAIIKTMENVLQRLATDSTSNKMSVDESAIVLMLN